MKGEFLQAVKPGVVFSIGPLPFPEGQTFDSWTTIRRDAEAAPGKVVSPLRPFTTTTGLQGSTYTTRSAAESSQTWFVTNGTAIVRLDVKGSSSAMRAVAAEMARMARSITMTAP